MADVKKKFKKKKEVFPWSKERPLCLREIKEFITVQNYLHILSDICVLLSNVLFA